jgi:hypothetical protein
MRISMLVRPTGAHAEYVKQGGDGRRASRTKDMVSGTAWVRDFGLGKDTCTRKQANRRFMAWKDDGGT